MKSDYYKGAKRMVKDGVPIRVAAWVKELSLGAKTAMGKHDTGHGINYPYGLRLREALK